MTASLLIELALPHRYHHQFQCLLKLARRHEAVSLAPILCPFQPSFLLLCVSLQPATPVLFVALPLRFAKAIVSSIFASPF